MTTQLQPEDPNFEAVVRKEGARSGISLGIIITVIAIIGLYVAVSLSSFWMITVVPILISVLLPLIIVVFFVIALRKKVGGYWSFKQALVGTFVMFLVAHIISTVVSLGFQTFVEPDIQERMIRNMSNATVEFMESQGVSDDQIDAATAGFDESLQKMNEGGIGTHIQGFFITLIVLFVIALIFAAIFKRERPVFITDDDI